MAGGNNKDGKKKRVLVVGAGAAGTMAWNNTMWAVAYQVQECHVLTIFRNIRTNSMLLSSMQWITVEAKPFQSDWTRSDMEQIGSIKVCKVEVTFSTTP